MKKARRLFASVVAGLFLLLGVSVLAAAGPDLKGKTIRTIVVHPPGGIYDFWGRIVARHLGKHLPGHPSLIVQNMPGGGGFIGVNYLYAVARRDGLTIGIPFADLALAQRIGEQGVQYDARKLNYLGSPTGVTRVFWVRSALPYRSVEDLRAAKEPVVGGGIRRSGAGYTVPVILSEGLGFPLRMVVGFPGMAPLMTALARGEVDVVAADFESPAVLPRWKERLIRPLAYVGPAKKAVKEAGVPDMLGLDLKPEAAALLQLILPVEYAAYPFAAPPDVPEEGVILLQRAFDRVFRDPQFVAEAEKIGATVLPTSGPDVLALQESIFKAPAEVVNRYKAILTER